MPCTTLEEIQDFENYKKELKADFVIVRTRALPFRVFTNFKYNDRTAPMVFPARSSRTCSPP